MAGRYEAVLTAAEKLHVRLLRLLTGALTCTLWTMPVLGSLGIWDLMTHGPGLSGIFLILGFLAAYVCFLGILCWMCLVCRRLRIARRRWYGCFCGLPVFKLWPGSLCARSGKAGDGPYPLQDQPGRCAGGKECVQHKISAAAGPWRGLPGFSLF